MIDFDDLSLEEALNRIEKQTSYTFNYDAELVSAYRFSGKLRLDNIEQALDEILSMTALDYDRRDDLFLIKKAALLQGKICGYIKDALSGHPMEASHVYTRDGNYGTYTDAQGFFEFEVDIPKNASIILSYIGYKRQEIAISDWTLGTCPTFLIEADLDLFGEGVVITDYLVKGIVEGQNNGSYTLRPDIMRNRLATQVNDVLQLIEILPGVSSYNESTEEISIRGNSPDQNLILWEGVNLYGASHFFGMSSSVNPYHVKEINVFKEVFDPKYDNRVGGVIDISLAQDIENTSRGSVGLTLTDSHFNFRSPIIQNKLGIDFAYRRSVTDFYESPTLLRYMDKTFQSVNPDDDNSMAGENVSEEGPLFFDLSSKLIYQISDRWKTSLSFFSANDDFDIQILFNEEEFGITESHDERNTALSFNSSYELSEQSRFDLNYGRSSYESMASASYTEFEDDSDILGLTARNDLLDQEFSGNFHSKLSRSTQIGLGASYEFKEVDYHIIEINEYNDGDDEFVETEDQFYNLFGELKWRHNNLSTEIGVRNTWRVSTGNSFFSPRINMRYALSDQIKLKSSYGRFHQFMTQIVELTANILPNTNIWTLNNPDFDDSLLSNKFSFGFVFSNRSWLLDVNGYWIQTDGLSTFNTILTAGDNRGVGGEFNNKTRGLELLLKKSWKNYSMWVNYDISKSRFFEYGEDFEFPSLFDQRHKLSFVNTISFDPVQFSVSYQYKSGLPFSPPGEVIEFLDQEDELVYELSFEEINNRRLSSYHRLDLSGVYTFDMGDGNFKGELGFSILNVLGRNNIYSRSYYLRDVEEEDGEEEIPEAAALDKFLLQRTPQISFRIFW